MIKTLHSLRFLFAMMILMSHFSYGGLQPFDAGGDGGVTFFFILSGFVLCLGYGPKIDQGVFSYRVYMQRRLIKTLPLHWLCLVLFLLVSHGTIDIPTIFNALLLQSWVPKPEFYFSCNSVSWFLSCILFCYLVFPYLYCHASCRVFAVALIACVVIYIIVPYERLTNFLYVNPLVRMVDFFMGVMLAKLYSSHQLPAPPAWAEWVVVVLLAAALMVYPYADAKLRNAPLFWIVLIPFVFVFAHGRGRLSRFLATKPLQILGSISMPLFLIHKMVISAVLRRIPDMHYMLALALCIAVALSVSWLVDRYLLRFIFSLIRTASDK